MHKLISSGLLIGLFVFAGQALAHEGELLAQTDVDADVGSDTSLPVDADADIYIGSDRVEDTGAPADGSGEPAPDSYGQTDVILNVSAKDAASASLDAESATLAPEAVLSADDLSAFVTAQMKRDENIRSIDVREDGVSVAYRMPARFLGFIPASLKARAHVTIDGEATISYPWYRFLFAVDGEEEARATLAANAADLFVDRNTGVDFSATMEAQIISAIHAAFAGAVASADADAGVTADMAGDVTEIEADNAAGGTFEAGSPEAEAAADDPDAIAQ